MTVAVPPQPSEEALVDAARGGDQRAFEQLYRDHAGRVYGLCLRLVADPTEAEQLTQDAFVQAWRKLDRFDGQSALGTWLHRLTTNLVLDWLRARGRRRQREEPLDPVEEADRLRQTAPPARVIDRLELERAIAALPDGARTVFVLAEVEGYPLKEIAARMGVAEGTVKAQNHRARRLLREALR
ncbi:sigma-70 family RNA polymerase sigma factor [bacterium]|nr:sigma-70 family RNA polymerase sigma factor [bacterium]